LLSAYQGLESFGKLLIVGPGKRIDSVSPEITDLGEVDEDTKQHLLSCCSLLCVPSSDESFGIVYVEAMSYGKPVVALDIYPVNEIIENGKTGILVSQNPENLHRALKKLLTNETLRKEMGKAARHCFESRYSNEKVIGRYKELYSAAAK
jgi:glycosyltransferase involved in cell wall biosynthesis